MWILESEGDFLEGKRVWLRPGKKYLFGRIKQAGVRHAIDHTTISRKHLVIEVAPVRQGDGTHIHTRSKVTVTDQSSKCGTTLDGEQIKGQSRELREEEHTIKLGRYQHILRIKWNPVVLTFSLSSKELKAKDPLAHVRSRLEDLDIKMIVPYLVGTTTHVVQSKRNTAKGLQALIDGKHIVQDSYIDALVYAATPEDLNSLESLSPLETDFDSAWPDPAPHLPPPGKEPVPRPADAFAPNPNRTTVFEDYTFVFCDSSQFDNLQAPITNGHGKALLYSLENGKTTADELVKYMRNAGGNKGFGEPDEHGGVVLVRFRSKGEHADWAIDLSNQVALITDQRVIEQGEFLDAILNNDATPLRRALPLEERPSEAQEPGLNHPNASNIPGANEPVNTSHDTQPAKTEARPAKRPRTMRNFVSKVKTFDDGFDMEAIPVYTLEKEDEVEISQPPENDSLPADDPSQAHSTREEDDVVTELLPGAVAMKQRHPDGRSKRQKSNPPPEPPRPKRQKLNVLEAARQRREAQEEAARDRIKEEEDSIKATLSSMDIDRMKSLAVVEEMEIPVRKRNNSARDDHDEGEEGDGGDGSGPNRRWDERWNGRKNFKNFRRTGDVGGPRRRVQAVIVPLEEVGRKNLGIGEEYWAGGRDSGDGNGNGGASGGRSRGAGRATSTTSNREAVSQDDNQSMDNSQPTTAETGRSSTGASGRFRKRQREVEEESDSEDELRFRFRRRKKT